MKKQELMLPSPVCVVLEKPVQLAMGRKVLCHIILHPAVPVLEYRNDFTQTWKS